MTKRILLTGMSGVGKSAVVAELRGRGYRAIDADQDGWSRWVPTGGNPTGAMPGHDWLWDEARVSALLAEDAGELLFVSGCAKNMVRFYPQFDAIVLLSAAEEVLLSRIVSRSENPYGKRPEERDRVLAHVASVEPLLRQAADYEVDSSVALAEVADRVLQLVQVEE